MSWILELIDKQVSRAILGFEVSGKHLSSRKLVELRMELNPPNRPSTELPCLHFTMVRRRNHLEPILGQPRHLVAVRVDRGQCIDSGKQGIGNQGHPLEAKLRGGRPPARIFVDQGPGDHLVSITDAEYDSVLIDGSSNQRDQGIICWITARRRQLRATDHNVAASRVRHEPFEMIEIHDMDRTPRDLLEPGDNGARKPLPVFGFRNAVDDQDHGRILTSCPLQTAVHFLPEGPFPLRTTCVAWKGGPWPCLHRGPHRPQRCRTW